MEQYYILTYHFSIGVNFLIEQYTLREKDDQAGKRGWILCIWEMEIVGAWYKYGYRWWWMLSNFETFETISLRVVHYFIIFGQL